MRAGVGPADDRVRAPVADTNRDTAPRSASWRGLTTAPDLDWWAVVEPPLNDLVSLADGVWLVIDDPNELRAAAAQRQPELLVMLAPELRFVLAARTIGGWASPAAAGRGGDRDPRGPELRCSVRSEAEIAQSWMVVRPTPERPVVFALRVLDGEIVDRCMPHNHQSLFVEFPVLVAVGAEPVS